MRSEISIDEYIFLSKPRGDRLGKFIAKSDLPRFIAKEEIMGKSVFDSELVYLGIVEDWTYGSDGKIRMVVNKKEEGKEISKVSIPFSHINKVGQCILLEKKIDERKIAKRQEESRSKKKEGRNEGLSTRRLSAREYFDEIEKANQDGTNLLLSSIILSRRQR